MSETPSTLNRVVPSKSVVPSQEIDGRVPLAMLFKFGPRLTGADQAAAIESLLALQMS